jgi:hypothetical protein
VGDPSGAEIPNTKAETLVGCVLMITSSSSQLSISLFFGNYRDT